MLNPSHVPVMSNEPNQTPQTVSYPPPMPIRTARQGGNAAYRQALALGGLGLIVLSIPVGFLTPVLPVGLPMAIVGAVLFGRNAVWARHWMEGVLARHPRLEKLAPDWMMTQLFGRKKRAFTD